MRVFSKIWAAILVLSAVFWFIDGVRALSGFVPLKFSIFVAFMTTGCCVLKWAYEYWTGKA